MKLTEQEVKMLEELLKKFDPGQIFELSIGIADELDYSKYGDNKFNCYQMREIRRGLRDGIDVSEYSNPNTSYVEMAGIRCQLIKEKVKKEEEK